MNVYILRIRDERIAVFDENNADDAVRVVIVTGAGNPFAQELIFLSVVRPLTLLHSRIPSMIHSRGSDVIPFGQLDLNCNSTAHV
jgi:hypothetical protein